MAKAKTETKEKKEKKEKKEVGYTVKYTEVGKKRPRSAEFPTLPDAREFGNAKNREGNFISLHNPKGVWLPLAIVNRQQVGQDI